MLGGLDSHDDVCAEIAFNTKTKVISVDYALFPENSFFDAIDDCIKVINSLPQSSSIILAGDSAGGTLAANLSSYFASKRGIKVVGQVLIYPGLGGDGKSGSYKRHSNSPLLSQRETNFYRDQIFNSLGTERVPSGLVLKDGDFTNLPTTIVFSAEFDPLCDDGTTL